MVRERQQRRAGAMSLNRWETGSSAQAEGTGFHWSTLVHSGQNQQTMGCRANPATTCFWMVSRGAQLQGRRLSCSAPQDCLPNLWLPTSDCRGPERVTMCELRIWLWQPLGPSLAVKSQSQNCPASGHLPNLRGQCSPEDNARESPSPGQGEAGHGPSSPTCQSCSPLVSQGMSLGDGNWVQTR